MVVMALYQFKGIPTEENAHLYFIVSDYETKEPMGYFRAEAIEARSLDAALDKAVPRAGENFVNTLPIY